MKLILNMYDHAGVMHVTFHLGVVSYRRDLPFDYLNFNDFSVVFPNFVSNGWNLMKLTLNKYLSYDVASGSEITPCNKICKPLVVYRFTGNVTTSITTLRA